MYSVARTIFTACFGLLFLFAVNAIGASDTPPGSAVGTWVLDASRSTFQGLRAPKFELIVIFTDAPGALKWTRTVASSDGRTFMESYDGPIDGKVHPMKGRDGQSTVAYVRASPSNLQWVVKDAKGSLVEKGDGQISPDGKTLTVRGLREGASGKGSFLAVYSKSN